MCTALYSSKRVSTLIAASGPHNQPGKQAEWRGWSYFADEETEAQDGEATCPESPRSSLKTRGEAEPPAPCAPVRGRLGCSRGGRSPPRGKRQRDPLGTNLRMQEICVTEGHMAPPVTEIPQIRSLNAHKGINDYFWSVLYPSLQAGSAWVQQPLSLTSRAAVGPAAPFTVWEPAPLGRLPRRDQSTGKGGEEASRS